MYPVLHSSSSFAKEYTDTRGTMATTFAHTVWPSSPAVPEHIKALLRLFFEVGDSSSLETSRRLGDEVFTTDGQIVVNKKVISGADGIMPPFLGQAQGLTSVIKIEISTSNHGLLSGLKSRKHTVDKVFTSSEAADDLVLIGSVRWTFKSGGELDGPFAARAVVDQSSERPRLKLYQGWAVRYDSLEHPFYNTVSMC